MRSGAAKHDFRDVLLANELRDGGSDIGSFETHDLRANVLCEAEIGLETFLVGFAFVAAGVNVDHEELRTQALRHASSAGNKILRGGIGTDADGDTLAHGNAAFFALLVAEGLEIVVDGLGDMAECKLAQSDEVAFAEEILQSALGAVGGVDVAAAHAALQSFRSEVGHHDFIDALKDPVGYRFSYWNASEALHRGSDAFEVLDVERGKDVDAGVQNFEDVFVSLAVLAALDVRVSQLVDEHHGGMPRENGVDVHLFEGRAFVRKLLAGDHRELVGKFGGGGAAVGFDDADHHILSATVAADGFAEHAVGLADAGGIAKEEFESAAGAGGRRFFQPLFGRLRHGAILPERVQNVELRYNRLVNRTIRVHLFRYSVACGAVAAVAMAGRVLHVNVTTMALGFLLVVLCVSATWGLRCAGAAALASTLVFNYLFLPPVGTFTISDPQNWVALFAFFATAVIASRLAERARREAQNANDRRREVERLYEFSQRLLVSDHAAALLNTIPGFVVDAFDVRAAAVSVADRSDVYRSRPEPEGLDTHDLQLVGLRGEPNIDSERGVAILPLRMGTRVVGSLGVAGHLPSRGTLEALSSVIAIAIERAGAIERLTHAEAARESEQLRTLLLDSVTHEFRTPLTGIKAAVTSLLSSQPLEPSERNELLMIINEESDRLNRLVGEAAEMAQLQAGEVKLELASHDIRDAVDRALAETKLALAKHTVEVLIPEGLPPVRMDVLRIAEVLIHFLENAAKYSPPNSAIHLSAEVRNRTLMTSVADHGPGIDEFEQPLIFDKFYRGRNQRLLVQGAGMGLAISKAIVEAHGGTIGVTSQLGRGSVFYFVLPEG